jgi:glucose-6-phosphate isomerase
VSELRDSLSASLPPELDDQVRGELAAWRDGRKIARLWDRDATLWTAAGEERWLGWLSPRPHGQDHHRELAAFAAEVRDEGFRHALLLGMGGSSLAPEVLALTFGPRPGHPRLHVLDSTDPAQIRDAEAELDLARTLVIVSSKSGTTLETTLLADYFAERLAEAVGEGEAPQRFVAVTDPGSGLEAAAHRRGYRRVFPGVPEIGGRFSALSNFGLMPAAVAGIDLAPLLAGADRMAAACRLPPPDNPGAVLGVILGILAGAGRDKVTFLASPAIAPLGAWLEQLLAESTGKRGRGIIPVDGEEPEAPGLYGDDRLFVYLRLASDPEPAQDAAAAALERAGQPVVRIALAAREDLGGEFFRWEVATAVAGAVLGVDPFDQPDVEASKVAARELTAAVEAHGALPPEEPALAGEGLALFADPANAAALAAAASEASVAAWLRAHLARLEAGDYFALLAYLERGPENRRQLQLLRQRVRDARGVATCLGFGPRFLHSTGQAYKGGPPSGVFLQLTCDDARDLAVPGRAYTFGTVKAAQARGDLRVLAARGRRLLRVHLGADVAAGLHRLGRLVAAGLSPPP